MTGLCFLFILGVLAYYHQKSQYAKPIWHNGYWWARDEHGRWCVYDQGIWVLAEEPART